jgi:2-hydroxychromene-2-carboxylate isomerase
MRALLSPAIAPQSGREGPIAKHIDYYVSLNSPWTYLGSKRFEAIVKKHGAHVTIWPVDFGSVFAVSGGLPLPKRAPQRQALPHDGAQALRAITSACRSTSSPSSFPPTRCRRRNA